jgi:sialate O-acetylesterase
MRKNLILVTYFSLLFSAYSNGQVRLPAIISNGMVLQRNAEIKIWGWASRGETVSIHFLGDEYETGSLPATLYC